jgi:hypothetical protein
MAVILPFPSIVSRPASRPKGQLPSCKIVLFDGVRIERSTGEMPMTEPALLTQGSLRSAPPNPCPSLSCSSPPPRLVVRSFHKYLAVKFKPFSAWRNPYR